MLLCCIARARSGVLLLSFGLTCRVKLACGGSRCRTGLEAETRGYRIAQ